MPWVITMDSYPYKKETSPNSLRLCWEVSRNSKGLLKFEGEAVNIEIEVDFTIQCGGNCVHERNGLRRSSVGKDYFSGPMKFEELRSVRFFVSTQLFNSDEAQLIFSGVLVQTGGDGKWVKNPVYSYFCACDSWPGSWYFSLILESSHGGLFPTPSSNSDVALSCDRARLSKFASLFGNPADSDVTIVTSDGQEIKVASWCLVSAPRAVL